MEEEEEEDDDKGRRSWRRRRRIVGLSGTVSLIEVSTTQVRVRQVRVLVMSFVAARVQHDTPSWVLVPASLTQPRTSLHNVA